MTPRVIVDRLAPLGSIRREALRAVLAFACVLAACAAVLMFGAGQ